MQTMAIRTVTNSLPKNEVILLTLLISKRYIPYTDLRKKFWLFQNEFIVLIYYYINCCFYCILSLYCINSSCSFSLALEKEKV